jgi:hypothetical protein
MAQRGGKRAGSGRPKGAKAAATLIREAVALASQIYSAERVLEEIGIVAMQDMGDYVDARGTWLPLNKIPPAARRVLAGLRTTKYNKPGVKDGIQEDVLDIRLHSKMEALITLARYHGLLKDRLEVTGDKPLRERISQARSRLAAARK